MTWVATTHGCFDAPEGWVTLENSGAADGPMVGGAVRRSLVVTSDVPIEGKSPAEYIAMQGVLLPEVLPGYESIESRALSGGAQGPWLLHHRFEMSGEPRLVQWQVYFFEPDRVGILTATAAADGAGDLQALLFRAMGSFAFPERGSPEDGEPQDHRHDREEDQHQSGDHP